MHEVATFTNELHSGGWRQYKPLAVCSLKYYGQFSLLLSYETDFTKNTPEYLTKFKQTYSFISYQLIDLLTVLRTYWQLAAEHFP